MDGNAPPNRGIQDPLNRGEIQEGQDPHNATAADTIRNRVDIDLPRVVQVQRPAEVVNEENATVQ